MTDKAYHVKSLFQNPYFWIFLVVGIVGIVALTLSMVFYEEKEIGDSIYFNGSDNIECYPVRIDRNDFLDSYYYKEECKIVGDEK